jgi:hypothetical protein
MVCCEALPEFVSDTASEPCTAPVVVGVKLTTIEHAPPARSGDPHDRSERSFRLGSPCSVAVTVAGSVPLFVIVTTSRVAVCDTTVWPKSNELLFTFSDVPAVVKPHPDISKPSGSISAEEKSTRLLIITVLLKMADSPVVVSAHACLFATREFSASCGCEEKFSPCVSILNNGYRRVTVK